MSILAALSRPLVYAYAYRLQRGSPETAGLEWGLLPPLPLSPPLLPLALAAQTPFSARFPCSSSFHNFNTLCRGNDEVEMVGFTAAQVLAAVLGGRCAEPGILCPTTTSASGRHCCCCCHRCCCADPQHRGEAVPPRAGR